MDNDDKEYGGKLAVVDDLVEHDDGQYLPSGEGDEDTSGGPTAFYDPNSNKAYYFNMPDFYKQMKAMRKAKEELDNTKKQQPAQ
jgi:hypothetical protein